MKKTIFLILACMFLISCNKNEENNPISEKLLRDSIINIYKSRGNVQIISPDLILLTEFESNGDQPVEQRGAYQCAVTYNHVIHLSSLKQVDYQTAFNTYSEKVVEAILKKAKLNGLDEDEIVDRQAIKRELENMDFKIINKDEFNFILYMSSDSCESTIFNKNLPLKVIEPYLTDWFKNKLTALK